MAWVQRVGATMSIAEQLAEVLAGISRPGDFFVSGSTELPLPRIIDASPVGDLTFLVTDFGKPFTAAGFGNWFRERCNEAGLPHCSAHGLRKAAATVAADNGATAHELMSIFGWLKLEQAGRYTRSADRTRLARVGMARLVPSRRQGSTNDVGE